MLGKIIDIWNKVFWQLFKLFTQCQSHLRVSGTVDLMLTLSVNLLPLHPFHGTFTDPQTIL